MGFALAAHIPEIVTIVALFILQQTSTALTEILAVLIPTVVPGQHVSRVPVQFTELAWGKENLFPKDEHRRHQATLPRTNRHHALGNPTLNTYSGSKGN